MGWDWTFALMRYGPRWKEHRRVFHSHFNHSVTEHQEIQLEISRELLILLLKEPENYVEQIRQCVLFGFVSSHECFIPPQLRRACYHEASVRLDNSFLYPLS
jgi:hypothetical protein